MAVGAFAMITGFTNCEKEKQECCTVSYTEDNITVTVKACQDGNITYTYTAGGTTHTETESWLNDYDSWSEVKGYMIDYGGSCFEEEK